MACVLLPARHHHSQRACLPVPGWVQDMFHTTLLATCMSLTAPASTLSVERPLPRVLSMGVILPVLAQVRLSVKQWGSG
jgi:hypothetical protein